MAQKPKARSPAKKASAAEKQKEQSARFIKAAQAQGADSKESAEAFDRALTSITKPKQNSG
jgi:hypothetical protein